MLLAAVLYLPFVQNHEERRHLVVFVRWLCLELIGKVMFNIRLLSVAM